MGILRSRGRENKKDILGKGIIFAHADISACIGGLGGHCRELKREEFLNEGVLNFKAACMNSFFFFFSQSHVSECVTGGEKTASLLVLRLTVTMKSSPFRDCLCWPVAPLVTVFILLLKLLQLQVLKNWQEIPQCGQQIIFDFGGQEEVGAWRS